MTRKLAWGVVIAGAVVLTGLLVGGAVEAHIVGSRTPFREILSDVHLTGAQKEQVKQILQAEQPRLEPLMDRMIQARRALSQAVAAPTLDEAAVRAAAEGAGKAGADLAVATARVASRVRALLTAEQQGKLDDAIRKAGDRLERRVKLGRGIWRQHMADFIDAL